MVILKAFSKEEFNEMFSKAITYFVVISIVHCTNIYVFLVLTYDK